MITIHYQDNICSQEITVKEDSTLKDYIYLIKDESVTIIEYIGNSTNVIIPDSIEGHPVTVIEKLAFYNKNLSSVMIPNTVNYIGERAFEKNLLTTLTIPNSVKSIGLRAFYWNKITEIFMQEGLIEINKYAFAQNLLEVITIPSTIEKIEDFAFAANRTLNNINIKKPQNTIHGHEDKWGATNSTITWNYS